MDEETLLGVAVLFALDKPRRKRSKWSKNWYLRRRCLSHINLLNELHFEPSDWSNYLRMSEETYLELLNLVTPYIIKKNTNMRSAITPHEKLSATLRYLASGSSFQSLRFPTAISAPALCQIIPNTCEVIIKVLKEYIKLPRNTFEWAKVAEGFEAKWQFPNCLGAVDGKHVRIIPPAGSGSLYWNYKKFHSIVLMAVANSNYEFIMCDVGCNGSISDGGVIEQTLFFQKLIDNDLHLPSDRSPTDSSENKLPYVFLGDEAFALRENFLKPFNKKQLNYDRMVFNYRLSRARRIIENTFGIMSARFQIFHSAIQLKDINNMNNVVLACCYLHNFLRRKTSGTYMPSNFNSSVDNEPPLEVQGFVDLQHYNVKNSSNYAKECREKCVHYFVNEGACEWQNEMVQNRYTLNEQ